MTELLGAKCISRKCWAIYSSHELLQIEIVYKSDSQFVYRGTVGAICRTRKNKSPIFRSPAREPGIQKLAKSYSLWSPGTYNFINFNFLCRGAPVLKKPNSEMLFIWSFCPPPYVIDIGTILFALFSTSVCKTYVKKTNWRMLNFLDMSSLKFK
jgi:hypothetical protein